VKVTLLVVGKVRAPLKAAVAEYETRAARYWKLEVVEVEAGAAGQSPPARVLAVEAERLLQHVPPSAELVALTCPGEAMSSTELARYLGDLALHGSRGVVFVIGGAHGLGEALLARARRQISLSALTLPHEMARLLLAEQLYRAGTLLRGEPYHKGVRDGEQL
jgi:23S rRNA (pseudouridine1915-N3)-methyltransferase